MRRSLWIRERRSLLFVWCVILLIFLIPSLCCAETENQNAPGLMNIQIPVPEGMTSSIEGNEYYIYAGQKGSIPYVMLKTYRGDDGVAFLREFTAYMQQKYTDLTVTADIRQRQIGDRTCYETDYQYQVSGYEVTDRRIVLVTDGTAYLFTSKEVEALGLTVGTLLEDVVANSTILSEEDLKRKSGLADGYLYCQENGMPLYWLDFTGIVSDRIVLHCCASTGDPATCERCLLLDLATADITQEGITIHQVMDLEEKDLTGHFRLLKLQIFLDGILMTAEPDETSSDKDAKIGLPSGSFAMIPMNVATDAEIRKNHLRPATDGPYQMEELQAWARIYTFRVTGSYLMGSEAVENPDGTYNIYLFEGAVRDKDAPVDASLRYVVDAYGEGVDFLTKDPVSMMK